MFEIPESQLPPGFAETVDREVAEPVEPRPAATVVMLRDGDAGPQVLLLRRQRSSAFVPGAWVFPGGRVDEADADPDLARRLGLADDIVPPRPYWAAAIREAFEETGVLLATDADGARAPTAAADPELEALRERLMEDRITLLDVLQAAGLRVRATDLVPFARWITPVQEPRRYDTRFFLARPPDGAEATADLREMTDLAWVAPDAALDRFRAGSLPMVFPTVRTLEGLVGFDSVHDAVGAYRGRAIPAILPRLVRTERGVGIVVD